MPILVIILLIIGFVRTISYGIYELKQHKNVYGSIVVFILATVGLFFPVIEIVLNYYI